MRVYLNAKESGLIRLGAADSRAHQRSRTPLWGDTLCLRP
jgi:hypothetical protein